MNKYKITYTVPVEVEIIVDANTEKEAISDSEMYVELDSYIGNGGYNKIIGTSEENVKVFPEGGYITMNNIEIINDND